MIKCTYTSKHFKQNQAPDPVRMVNLRKIFELENYRNW